MNKADLLGQMEPFFPNDGTPGNHNSDLEQSEEDKHHIINIVFLKSRIPKSLSHHVFFTGKSNLEDLGATPMI